MTVSVLLVDDVAELRSVLRQTLRLRGGFDVVAEAGDGASAIAAAARHQPDVVVLDLGLPDLAGREVLTRLRAVSPASQVVVYTASVTADQAPFGDAIAAYVSKDSDVAYLASLLADLGRGNYRGAALHLGPGPGDVAVARRFLDDHCRAWECESIAADAELVVSELVTNALIHAGTRCELRVGLTDVALHLQVTDEGGGMPDPRAADDGSENGRGLLLVSLLCVAWGVEALPGGDKVVWAELLRSPGDTSDKDEAGVVLQLARRLGEDGTPQLP